MAIYHFSAQIFSRKAKQGPNGDYVRPGSKVAAAAAYRSGTQLRDYRTGEVHDYSNRKGVAHAEVMVPAGGAAWLEDRELLWATVERMETRVDAQLAREFNMALPYELDGEQRLQLVRGFVQTHFVNRGMVADIALHDPIPEMGQNPRNFHAHVMLTLRKATPDGLHPVKTREWNSKELLNLWRTEWALACNMALERAGQRVRVDHRTLEAQRDYARELGDVVRSAALNRKPEIHVGPKARQMAREQRQAVSRQRGVNAPRRPAQGMPAERRQRNYPTHDRGTRLDWLERIVAGNNDQLRRDLERLSRRADRLERKMDYWQRRMTFLAEGKIGGAKFRFERWQAAERRKQDEAARRIKLERARRRHAQLVAMRKQMGELARFGALQREKGLARAREIRGWALFVRDKARTLDMSRVRLPF